MMKTRWCVYLLIGFFSLAVLSASISAVTGAQSWEADDDDEDALEDPLPDWVELRVFIHRPRVVKPNHLGTCEPTANPKINHFEVTPWHLSGPIVWSLNRSKVPSSVAGSVDSVLNQSFNTWYSGLFSQGPDTRARRARFDNVNAILWKRRGRSTLGVTFVWSSRVTGEVLEADTVFNKRYPWAIFANSPDCQSSPEAYDLQNIATHEFGHWIGLDDLFDDSDKDLTMYGFGAGGEVKKRTLGTGDISGRNELHP
jgi:Matrixin